jgi:hypothetical protein
MAVRRPSVYRQGEFIFQDFLYFQDGASELRYILGKYDGEPYESVAQTFDYPPPGLRGGSIVSRVDYTVSGKSLTIDNWEVNWRDEWPLRLAFQFLANCLYSAAQGYSVRVHKDVYSFWVSENLFPMTNGPNDFLLR